jgi:hypothetical protein
MKLSAPFSLEARHLGVRLFHEDIGLIDIVLRAPPASSRRWVRSRASPSIDAVSRATSACMAAPQASA